DLLLFSNRYAVHLNYYNERYIIDGTWEPLMMMDVSVTLATLAKIDVKRLNDYKKLLYKKISLAPGDASAELYFKFLFDSLFSLATIIDNQYRLLPATFEYRAILKDIISGKLQLQLGTLENFFNDFKSKNLLDYSINELDSDAPVGVFSDKDFKRENLDHAWHTVPVPVVPITIPPLTDREKIVYIINHNLFNNAIETFLKGVATIVARAKDLFEKTLQDYPEHSPHYALFLAFTKLFKIAQDDLNRYTQRHLDFYYKDVLQLKNKRPQPDSAHLTFELQKPFTQHLLKKEILFKGGKDIIGKEITYRLTDELVLNKAKVAKIHAQQIDLKIDGTLKAFPIANSEDGQGAKLLAPDKSWFTFGNSKAGPTNKAGFAIASNILFLNEGKREITVGISFKNKVPELLRADNKWGGFEVFLTGKKDWVIKAVTAEYFDNIKQLLFAISLDANDPAIIPYTERIHKENFETGLPLIKICLQQDQPGTIPYKVLCSNEIETVQIDVDVTGVRDLVLSNDTGTVDASKPFKPFGDFPGAGAGFYIGSKEVFQKELTQLSFKFEGDDNFKPAVEYLTMGVWGNMGPLYSNKIISGINITPTAIDFSKNENLRATTLEGFIQLFNK
ncbi:MAG: hypothetical protein ABIS01_09590, partial [Ferruginibacter sp.]